MHVMCETMRDTIAKMQDRYKIKKEKKKKKVNAMHVNPKHK